MTLVGNGDYYCCFVATMKITYPASSLLKYLNPTVILPSNPSGSLLGRIKIKQVLQQEEIFNYWSQGKKVETNR